MSEEKKKEAPASSEDMSALIKRFGQFVDRLEAGSMDESERGIHEAKRRIQELSLERDRLAESATAWEKRFKEGRVRRLLAEAASSAGAYRSEQVVALLTRHVGWSEDGKKAVLTLSGADGEKTKYDESGFAEGVKAFLAENPNLAAGGIRGGAGSRSSQGPASPHRGTTLEELKGMRSQLEERARQLR